MKGRRGLVKQYLESVRASDDVQKLKDATLILQEFVLYIKNVNKIEFGETFFDSDKSSLVIKFVKSKDFGGKLSPLLVCLSLHEFFFFCSNERHEIGGDSLRHSNTEKILATLMLLIEKCDPGAEPQQEEGDNDEKEKEAQAFSFRNLGFYN